MTGSVPDWTTAIMRLSSGRGEGDTKWIFLAVAVELHLPAYQLRPLISTYNPLIELCELYANIPTVSLTIGCSSLSFIVDDLLIRSIGPAL
jgi:hypothetical protein